MLSSDNIVVMDLIFWIAMVVPHHGYSSSVQDILFLTYLQKGGGYVITNKVLTAQAITIMKILLKYRY